MRDELMIFYLKKKTKGKYSQFIHKEETLQKWFLKLELTIKSTHAVPRRAQAAWDFFLRLFFFAGRRHLNGWVTASFGPVKGRKKLGVIWPSAAVLAIVITTAAAAGAAVGAIWNGHGRDRWRRLRSPFSLITRPLIYREPSETDKYSSSWLPGVCVYLCFLLLFFLLAVKATVAEAEVHVDRPVGCVGLSHEPIHTS